VVRVVVEEEEEKRVGVDDDRVDCRRSKVLDLITGDLCPLPPPPPTTMTTTTTTTTTGEQPVT